MTFTADREALLKNLNAHGFKAVWFDTANDAKEYLCNSLKGETIGFGGSATSQEMGLYEALGEHNTVLWHWKNPADKEDFGKFTAYITSANAVSQTGELVNIDGTGNRVASTLYGPKKLFFVIGANKLCENLESAVYRARNVAAPLNAKRLNRKTPCAAAGKCMDCMSPERICNAMVIYMRPLGGFESTEVIVVGESLGM